ncbi:ABC transporter ATP-binding protein [Lapidilactobacillus achengensis]|uniref:ABC transporter ATP-binding protein n=1 Tax=Lapidilactobacillus achengensis TaxID=2486000 RepID=A0ABW1UQC4_9LACO|nr:ABC transporter ATP-binding protein [Lapidilactobacillus achengensis]
MEKQQHTILQNVHYVLAGFAASGEHYLGKLILYYLLSLTLTLGVTALPALIVAQFEAKVALPQLLLQVGGLVLLLALAAFFSLVVKTQADATITRGRFKSFELKLYQKLMTTDYENTLTNRFQKLLVNALTFGVYGDGSGVAQILQQFGLVGLDLLLIVGFSLYATTQIPYFFVLIVVELALTYLVVRFDTNYRQKTLAYRDQLYAQQNYLTRTAGNIKNGKEIRLFKMDNWLAANLDQTVSASLQYQRQLARHTLLANFWESLFSFLRDSLVFVVLIILIQRQQISVASFVLYFNILAQMNGWLRQLLSETNDLKKSSQDIDHLRNFLTFPEFRKHYPDPTLPQNQVEIRFDHVSYRYPDATEETLHDVSFTIKAGERLALVGNNGAGKSTIVNLLLGLLRPTAGQIYFDGVAADQFSQAALADLVTPVFQSTDIWATTIAQTVAMVADETAIDEAKVKQVLEQVGLLTKIQALPQGIHSHLTRYIHSDGVEFSGGETQRLMLARALYRQTPAILLDEPTAALDALAESELYEEYQDLIGAKTSLFISHRLASTRFCDRIILLYHGVLKEQGTHEELMAQNGIYAEMFAIQSQYYQDQEEDESDESVAEN